MGIVVALLAAPAAAAAAPVLSTEVPAGGGKTAPLASAGPHPKEVDGRTGDWRGTLPDFGGAVLYSAGELVYQDHLFDAWGADDGRDASGWRSRTR